MSDLAPTIIEILHHYMRDATATIASGTTFCELEIDRLDLPMIILDIEDALGVQIQYEDEIEHLATVEKLVAFIEARLNAKNLRRRQCTTVNGNWMSTGAERRR